MDSLYDKDDDFLWKHLAIAVVVGVLALLTGCDKYTKSGETVGQKVDKVIDKTNATVDKAETKISEAGKSAENAVKAAGTVIDDSAITASIKSDLIKDPGLSALNIDVNTVKGEVTLKGEVASDAARERAGHIASAVNGVVKVNNTIKVKS